LSANHQPYMSPRIFLCQAAFYCQENERKH